MKAALATVLLAMTVAPLSASAQSFEERLSFHPEVPAEKSDVAARISLTAPTPCEKVELQDFDVKGNEISINVQITHPSPDTICAQVLKEHSLAQEIGPLKAGAYNAHLYVNGEERASSQLFVTAKDMAVLATGKFVDEQGDTMLAGEVRNDGNNPARMVAIDILFFDKDTLVRQERAYTTMAVLMPGMTSAFSLPLSKDLQGMEYSARVTSFDKADPLEKQLRLTVEPRLRDDGYGEVVGSVANNSGRDATQVKIVCAIYDAKGAIIDSVFGYTDPENIAPNLGAPFTILTHNSVDEFAASCNAESQEFATAEVVIVPEFPAASIVFAASLAALAAYRFRDKL